MCVAYAACVLPTRHVCCLRGMCVAYTACVLLASLAHSEKEMSLSFIDQSYIV